RQGAQVALQQDVALSAHDVKGAQLAPHGDPLAIGGETRGVEDVVGWQDPVQAAGDGVQLEQVAGRHGEEGAVRGEGKATDLEAGGRAHVAQVPGRGTAVDRRHDFALPHDVDAAPVPGLNGAGLPVRAHDHAHRLAGEGEAELPDPFAVAGG